MCRIHSTKLERLLLDFAALQATNGRLMKMQDWISKLDNFLKLSEKEILQGTGAVSRTQALEKANKEFQHYGAPLKTRIFCALSLCADDQKNITLIGSLNPARSPLMCVEYAQYTPLCSLVCRSVLNFITLSFHSYFKRMRAYVCMVC